MSENTTTAEDSQPSQIHQKPLTSKSWRKRLVVDWDEDGQPNITLRSAVENLGPPDPREIKLMERGLKAVLRLSRQQHLVAQRLRQSRQPKVDTTEQNNVPNA